VLSIFTIAFPFDPLDVIVTVRPPSNKSWSFAKTSMVTTSSSSTDALSSIATG